jgi:hypothetical protein
VQELCSDELLVCREVECLNSAIALVCAQFLNFAVTVVEDDLLNPVITFMAYSVVTVDCNLDFADVRLHVVLEVMGLVGAYSVWCRD